LGFKHKISDEDIINRQKKKKTKSKTPTRGLAGAGQKKPAKDSTRVGFEPTPPKR
jgi:hypothetical protein